MNMDDEIKTTSTPEYCSAWIYRSGLRATAEASFIGPDWWVNRVIVNPPGKRGGGIGGRLLERLKEVVKERGVKTLLVTPGAYDGEYVAQVRFYRKHGFDDADCAEEGLLKAKL